MLYLLGNVTSDEVASNSSLLRDLCEAVSTSLACHCELNQVSGGLSQQHDSSLMMIVDRFGCSLGRGPRVPAGKHAEE